MVDFKKLKKSSADLDRLNQEIAKLGGRQTDERYWKLDVDKAGNGSAIIRFLPAPAVDGDEGMPFVRYWRHAFKGPTGKWYIENCLTTFQKPDPVAELNSYLWGLSDDKDSPSRKQATKQKRQLKYVANILVVSDPKHPENEGKVFLFAFGAKIFDKIKLLMNPDDAAQALGDKPVNPFHLWEGANFRVRQRKGDGGFPNYDQSSFETPSPVGTEDSYREKIWNSEFSLKEILADTHFKSYDELKARLNEVLGSTTETLTEKVAERKVSKKSETPAEVVGVDEAEVEPEDDADMEYFTKLAAE